MITRPTEIQKGVPASFVLDVGVLAAHPHITDSYYQDDSNWSKVSLFYRSSFGNQTTDVTFEVAQGKLEDKFEVSSRARSLFQIASIFLYDFDGAFFIIPRSALSQAEKELLDVILQ